MEQVVRKKRKGISPVWILPLVAVIIGSWLVYKSIHDAGIDIEVFFDNAAGVTAGKTQVIYKGIPVGLVKSVEVDKELQKIVAYIDMVKESKERIVEDMQFWIVRPEVSVNRITGLDTLVAGSYISVMPGKSMVPARSFQGLDSAPPLPADTPGLRLTLISADTASLRVSSPVYFKKIQVGEVLTVGLNKKKNKVAIELLIYQQHQSLVNNTTVFWNSSGLSFDANLNGISMQMDSLTSLLSGGIAFESRTDGPPLELKKKHELHKTRNEAILSRGSRLDFHFEDMEGLNPGAPIRYKDVDIGEVVSVELGDDLRSLKAVGYAYEQAEELFKKETYVWMVTPKINLSGVENISTAIKGSYLNVAPGNGKPAHDFKVHPGPPAMKNYTKGITIVLQANRPDSLSKGSPVYYRQIRIGEVIHIELAQDSRNVNLYVGIDEKYEPLVRDTSQFWNASGIRITGGLMTELKFATESIQALLTGGITMAIPDEEIGIPVSSGHRFELLTDPTDGWKSWSPEIWISEKGTGIPKQ